MNSKKDMVLSIIGLLLFFVYIYFVGSIIDATNDSGIKTLLIITIMPLGTHFYCTIMITHIVSYAMRNMTKEEAIAYLKFQAMRDGYNI